MKENKKIKLIFIVVATIILIIAITCISIFAINKKNDKQHFNSSSEENRQENNNQEEVPEEKEQQENNNEEEKVVEEKTIVKDEFEPDYSKYIPDSTYPGLLIDDTSDYTNTLVVRYDKREKEFCYFYSGEDEESECSNKSISIKTKTKAEIDSVYLDRYVYYKDDGMHKIYDNKKKTSYIIKIDVSYRYIERYDDENNLVAIIFEKEFDGSDSYYSLTLGKVLYDEKYKELDYLSKEYLSGKVYKCSQDDDDEDCVQTKALLLSAKEEKIIKTYKISADKDGYYDEKEYGIFENENGKYFTLGTCIDSCNYDYIYNTDFKVLGKNYDNYTSGILPNGNLYLAKKGVVSEVDKDGNVIRKTKKYDIEQVVGGYIIHIKDNYLTITTIDEVEEYKIVKWNKKYYYHVGLSGWYTDEGKHGIYMVVEDGNVTAKDVWNYCTSHNSCEFDSISEIKDMNYGYEYYFIPETKEIGKIPTYIGGYAKPVLYLYPTKKTNVKVTFSNPNMLTTTYPKYNNSWEVTAYPNGDLYDKNNKYYYALYWEELKNHSIDFKEGFYVESKDAIIFLESKLSYIGLNDKERNEFIMYWLPILEKNEKNLIYFELTEERNSNSRIIISPKPDSLLRIAMHVKKVDEKINIKEQKLNRFNRTGFSAIEWGGVIH